MSLKSLFGIRVSYAPFLAAVASLLIGHHGSWAQGVSFSQPAVSPLAVGGRPTAPVIADVNIGFLWILAIAGVEGYGIMQPRVGVSLPSARRSWFVRLFAGDVGVDPYTRVVSDVYQDLFGEGSFVGKGIYDVDAFERTCNGFPENRILSHDLLESAYARSGLLSDVELYEDFPSRYMADVSRRHRWMRGDWQIAAWILPRVPDGGGKLVRNTISTLSKWKIFDNLRRSVTAFGGIALLLGSWALGPTSAWIAAALLLLSVGLVPLLSTLRELSRKQAEIPLRAHLLASLSSAVMHIAHVLFAVVFLAYDAYLGVDAILRTIARVCWTHCNLLEWRRSAHAGLEVAQ